MGTVKFTSDDTKTWYGTTSRIIVPLVSLTPVQLVGVNPVRKPTEDCRGDICMEFFALDGDISSFLFIWAGQVVDLDDYRLEQWINNSWQEVVTGNTDNTLGSELGTKFPFGSYPSYPNYSGYQIDWNKVINFDDGNGAGGVGTYRFKVVNTFTDPDEELYSQPIILKDFNCDTRDNTVKISFKSQGLFQNAFYTRDNNTLKDFDLINVTNGWLDEVRLSGRFDELPVESEETFVKYGSYENRLQLSDDFEQYNLRLFKTTLEQYKRLYLYGLRSHEIKITEGNSDSNFNFDKINVISKNESDFETFVNNRYLYNVNIKLQGEFDKGFRQC